MEAEVIGSAASFHADLPEGHGVLTYDPAVETAEEAAARSGRRGGFLCVPQALAADEWERAASAGQRRLIERAAIFARGEPDPGPLTPLG